MSKKEGDTDKDEAEFILTVGKFETHNGRPQRGRSLGLIGTSRQEQGPHFCKCQPHCVPPDCKDPQPRSWVRVGWAWKTGSSPDCVLTLFPTSIGRKNSSAIY